MDRCNDRHILRQVFDKSEVSTPSDGIMATLNTKYIKSQI